MNHYTLTQTAAKGNFFACFCHLREFMSVGLNTNNHFEAHKQAKAMEPEVLAMLARRAALKGKIHGINPAKLRPEAVHHFILTQRRAGKPYQACFCYRGQVHWVTLRTKDFHEALAQAAGMELEILAELARRAALKGKNPGASQPTQNSQEKPCDLGQEVAPASELTLDDALELQWDDIDFGGKVVHIRRDEKSGRVAAFAMSQRLRSWLQHRWDGARPNAQYVFWEF